MTDDARRCRRIEQARRLRDVPPGRTLSEGFEMMEFADRLGEAAERAQEH